jgi:hypothetical protein
MADDRLMQGLREIARIAGSLVADPGSPGDDGQGYAAVDSCRIMPLPARLQGRAAEVATKINPANSPASALASMAPGVPLDPQALTIYVSKYWGPVPKTLTVSFMESTASDLAQRIVSHMNAWAQSCGMTFALTSDTGDVRISREPGGYWSYLGTDVTLIPKDRQTMNLQGFTMETTEREYRRVVRHETGHTMGFPHEHMRRALVDRIDPEKAYEYFGRTQGWSRQMVDQQVLTALDGASIIGTEPDQDSIMCYQLPGSITKDGQPIHGAFDINATDGAFAATLYPQVLRTGGTRSSDPSAGDSSVSVSVPDWPADRDVPVPV